MPVRKLLTLKTGARVAAIAMLVPPVHGQPAKGEGIERRASVEEAQMPGSNFSYSIYIRAAPGTVWEALFDPEVERRCWPGLHLESTWKKGAAWRMLYADGRTANDGEVLEIERSKRLVLSWRNEARPERIVEGFSRAEIELEPVGQATKLSVTHRINRSNSTLIAAASESWPRILSNLKSLIETGKIALPWSL